MTATDTFVRAYALLTKFLEQICYLLCSGSISMQQTI